MLSFHCVWHVKGKLIVQYNVNVDLTMLDRQKGVFNTHDNWGTKQTGIGPKNSARSENKFRKWPIDTNNCHLFPLFLLLLLLLRRIKYLSYLNYVRQRIAFTAKLTRTKKSLEQRYITLPLWPSHKYVEQTETLGRDLEIYYPVIMNDYIT
jgi:hypothetical protein